MENNKVFSSIPDNPTSDDKLGFKKFTSQISSKLTSISDKDTPFTMGIYGEWGSGKTSFLKMIEDELKSNNIQTIWFNAWKYDKEKDLWASLVQTIIIQSKLNTSFFKRLGLKVELWVKGIKISSGINELIKQLLIFAVRIAILIGIFYLIFENKSELFNYKDLLETDKIKNIEFWSDVFLIVLSLFIAQPIKLISFLTKNVNIDFSKFRTHKTFQEHVSLLDSFNKEFYELLKIIRKKKPLVIFIDDLDRCLPEKAIEVFEAIKLFLDIQGCIFIIALDRNIVEKVVVSKHSSLFNSENNSINESYKESYLDKIVQLSFQIPPLSNEEIKNYIEHLLSSDIQDKNPLVNLFAENLPANPRRIKRIIQLFYFLRHFSSIENNNINELILAKFIIIQNQYQEIYEYCSNYIDFASFFEQYMILNSVPNNEGFNDLKEENIEYFEKAELFAKENPNIKQLFKKYNSESFGNQNASSYIFLLRTFEEVDEVKTKKEITISTNYLNRFNFFSPNKNNKLNTFQPVFSEDLIQRINHGLNNNKRIYIVGGPGTGKTTLGKWVLFNSMKNQNEKSPELNIKLPKSLLPIFIQAREMSINNSFDDIVNQQLENVYSDLDENENDIAKQHLIKGQSLILIDGLDEVGYERFSSFFKQVIDFINRFPDNRFILTSRELNNLEFTNSLSQFELININEVNKGVDIKRFVSNYLTDEEQSNQLLSEINSSKYLKDLATTPLLLTSIIQVYSRYKRLPTKRTSLIRNFINLLLEEWDLQRNISRNQFGGLTINEKYHLVSEIAFQASVKSQFQFDLRFISKFSSNELSKSNTSNILRLLSESGLIIEISKGVFSFAHKIYAEYLTAEYIINLEVLSDKIVEKLNDQSWANIWSLTFEIAEERPEFINQIIKHNHGIKLLEQYINTNPKEISDDFIDLIQNINNKGE